MKAEKKSLIPGLHWTGDGHVSLSGRLLDRARTVEALLRDWAIGMGAAEYRFPEMIAARHLTPIAYVKSFPHLATFVTSAARDDAAQASLAAECGDAPRIPLIDGRFEPIEQLLAPAACYHFYHRLAGESLEVPLLLTTECRCHRRESHYLPLRRQWSFSMRELVCFGDRAAVERFTGNCRRDIEAFAHRLGLDAAWHAASDPFFDPAADPKALAQLVEPAKQELKLADGLAIASINDHRGFFGECYGIRYGKRTARSACVAFGIERWLAALIERYGHDTAAWPEPATG